LHMRQFTSASSSFSYNGIHILHLPSNITFSWKMSTNNFRLWRNIWCKSSMTANLKTQMVITIWHKNSKLWSIPSWKLLMNLKN
jgi:hypothetical protein